MKFSTRNKLSLLCIVFALVSCNKVSDINHQSNTESNVSPISSSQITSSSEETHVHHFVTEEEIPASCLIDGYTETTYCDICGFVLIEKEIIPARGYHTFSEWKITKEPTYLAAGLKERICDACGEKEEESIPMLDKSLCQHEHFKEGFVFVRHDEYDKCKICLNYCFDCDSADETYEFNTGLPIVNINTNDVPILDKENNVPGNMEIMDVDSTVTNYSLNIKGRGNATWGYEKKPYKIKLDSKASLLGMKKNKSWALLANYCDKTLLRSAIGFETSKLFNLEYTVDYRFVELIINNEYLGTYQLCESIKEGTDRINVSDTGFIIESTQYDDKPNKFYSKKANLLYNFKFPDDEDITQEQLEYTESCINNLEEVLYSSDPYAFSIDKGYRNYIDVVSFAKWFLVQNVLANLDTNKYLTKYDNTAKSLIKMGPVWDFEWSIGIGWYYDEKPNPNHDISINHPYYSRLVHSTYFKETVKNEWNKVSKNIKNNLLTYIENEAKMIDKSQKLNFVRWDILNKMVSVDGIPLGSYEAELECTTTYLSTHIDWLSDYINSNF